MRADLSPAELRDWITGRLDPLHPDADSSYGVRSDFDLNNDHPVDGGVALKPAAVLMGLVERPEGLGLILTRRADTLRSHTGQVALPGGRQDPGETPWAAALREAEEEVGLDRSYVDPVGYLDLYGTSFGFRILPTVAKVRPGFTLRISRAEVDDAFEVPLAFLMNPANHQTHTREFRGMERSYYAMPYAERYIWGATAGILRTLYQRIYLS